MDKIRPAVVSGILALALLSAGDATAAFGDGTIDFEGHTNGDYITSSTFDMGAAGIKTVDITAWRANNTSSTRTLTLVPEARIYDTDWNNGGGSPANGDGDLDAPFYYDGEYNPSDPTENAHYPGKALIIQNPGATEPNDWAQGGRLELDFRDSGIAGGVRLTSIDVLDMDAGTAEFFLYDMDNNLIPKSGTEDFWVNLVDADTNNDQPNYFETVMFGAAGVGITGVGRIVIDLYGSGAINNVVVPIPAAAPLFASVVGLFGFLQSRRRKKVA